jgi:hypothetical protein
MTPLVVYAGVALVALGATYAYAFRYRDVNVYLSSGAAQLAWGWTSVHGGDVGINRGIAVQYLGGNALQYFALAGFVLSALVFMLSHFGAYPPGGEDETATETVNGPSGSQS